MGCFAALAMTDRALVSRQALRRLAGSLISAASRLRSIRRVQPSLTACHQRDARLRQRLLVPELAGDLFVLLIQPFAIIGEFAGPYSGAEAERGFQEPIGIGERLARGADDVAYAAPQHVLGHFEIVHAARADDRRLEPDGADGVANRLGSIGVAPERAALVRDILRHAFVAAGAGVGVGGGIHARLLGVVELAAARGREEIHPRARKGRSEEAGVLDRATVLDAFLREKPAADDEFLADPGAHAGEHLERQAHASRACTAPTVVAGISPREK